MTLSLSDALCGVDSSSAPSESARFNVAYLGLQTTHSLVDRMYAYLTVTRGDSGLRRSGLGLRIPSQPVHPPLIHHKAKTGYATTGADCTDGELTEWSTVACHHDIGRQNVDTFIGTLWKKKSARTVLDRRLELVFAPHYSPPRSHWQAFTSLEIIPLSSFIHG